MEERYPKQPVSLAVIAVKGSRRPEIGKVQELWNENGHCARAVPLRETTREAWLAYRDTMALAKPPDDDGAIGYYEVSSD